MPMQQPRGPTSGLSSGMDFNFCISENFHQEPSSAEELFFNGKLLPIKIKEKNFTKKQTFHQSIVPPLLVLHDDHAISVESLNNKDGSEETKISSTTSHKVANEKKGSWRFKQCFRMNLITVCKQALSLLPLLLQRKATTGATHKQGWQKSSLIPPIKPSQSPSLIGYQKPPLKKCYGPYVSNGNGLGISPILNIDQLGNLFCLSSIIFSRKYKNKRK